MCVPTLTIVCLMTLGTPRAAYWSNSARNCSTVASICPAAARVFSAEIPGGISSVAYTLSPSMELKNEKMTRPLRMSDRETIRMPRPVAAVT